MSGPGGHSAACCSIPPIIAKDYNPKGKYETIGGLKTYVTGPSDATTGIFIIYDIFGFFPQTIQGADILAYSDKDHQYQVFMPDFFEGEPADIAWYPPIEESQRKALGAWFQTRGPPTGVAKLPGILKNISAFAPNIKTWGALGFCWGGKVVSLTSAAGTPWKAAAQCHPAMISVDDASKIVIPICSLASKDESAEEHNNYGEALKFGKHVERFDDQLHGWMSARADLEDTHCREEYERGYTILLKFFAQYL